MEAATAKPIIDQLRGAGLSLTVKPDGKLTVSPSDLLDDDMRQLIRLNKPAIVAALTTPAANDPQPGTTRPPGLSPKLLAASKAIDQQIVDTGGTLELPPDPKPKLASVNKPVAPKLDTPKPKPTKHFDRPWKALATAYYMHHGHCASCIAAGLNNRYQRCGVGASLWTGYQNAIE